ncbi:kinase-like protein [Jackrogersella minutella]|nr:kinase-like protein [Jackrogersella minutella]
MNTEQRRLHRLERYDKFLHYRAGREWDRAERRTRGYGRVRLPRPGHATLDIPFGQRPDQVQYPYVKNAMKLNLDELDAAPLYDKEAKAWHLLQRIKYGFGVKRKFKYKRCLGRGGNGVAVQFEEVNEMDEPIRQLAVKMLLSYENPDHEEDLFNEMQIMELMRKAEHIVQLVYIPDEERLFNIGKQVTGSVPTQEQLPTVLLIMEMVENGDLTNFIQMVRERGLTVPNYILWKFFLCLIRGCIAMAFTPERCLDNFHEADVHTEWIPERFVDNPERIVHFDLDPKNIFVGSMPKPSDNLEHADVPILKMGDFGAARNVEEDQEDIYYELLRGGGKHCYTAPEQFCNDWDYIPPDSGTVKDHFIAGNYHWHTNLFQVGCTMEALVTLCYPAFPPIPSWCERAPPTGKERYVTYGIHLDDARYSHVDQQLRDVVRRCQAHYPLDRPRLDELVRGIEGVCADADISPQETQEWIRSVLLAPPAAMQPPPPPTTTVTVVNPADDVLPRPPATVDPYGNYIPPPSGGPAFPAYTPVAPMAPPSRSQQGGQPSQTGGSSRQEETPVGKTERERGPWSSTKRTPVFRDTPAPWD